MKLFYLSLMSLALLASSLYATQFKVNYKRGAVYLQRGSSTLPLRIGQRIYEKDTLVTKQRSFVAIGGSDGTLIKVAENTSLKLSEAYEDQKSRTHRMSLLKGKITSHVSKLRKRSTISYETPSVLVAVRGTTFTVDVSEEGDTTFYLSTGQATMLRRDPTTGQNITGTEVDLESGQMVEADVEEDGRLKVRNMNPTDQENLQKNIPQKLGNIDDLGEQPLTVDNAPEQQAQQDVEDLKNELREQINVERIALNQATQRVGEQREWDQTTEKIIETEDARYQVSQHYKQDGNTIRLISVTENLSSGQVSVLENESTYSSGIPNLLNFLNSENTSIRADIIRTRFLSSDGDKRDDLLFINYKGDDLADELFFNDEKAQAVEGNAGFLTKISTNKISPRYLISFTLPDSSDADKVYALKLESGLYVEDKDIDVADFLGGNGSTVSSDQLTALINQGLYGRFVLDEFNSDEKLLNNDSIVIILIGNMLIPISTSFGGL